MQNLVEGKVDHQLAKKNHWLQIIEEWEKITKAKEYSVIVRELN